MPLLRKSGEIVTRPALCPVTVTLGMKLVMLVVACSGCASAIPPRPAAIRVLSAARPSWSYAVTASDSLELHVEAHFDGAVRGPFSVDQEAEAFVRDVSVSNGAEFVSVSRKAEGWDLPCSSGCRVRYTYRLGEAADQAKDDDIAVRLGGAVFTSPSNWLLNPEASAPGRYNFTVAMPPHATFATGVRPSDDDGYAAATTTLEESSFAAFGNLTVHPLHGGGISVAIASGLSFDDETVVRWVDSEVSAISAYFGRAPDDRAVVFVAPGTSEMTHAKTLGGGGASVLVRVGRGVKASDLRDDWVVAHELVHVAFPQVGSEHAWFAEGLACYVEPVARVHAAITSPEKMWRDLMDGSPQGLPPPGDSGLEHTEEWGRVYWGGTLYFLLADIEIRKATNGAKSLRDAVTAIARGGANVETHQSLERVLADGDAATGTRVLSDFYARFGQAPGSVDLEALWRSLGITRSGESVHFDDGADLAWIRKAITADVFP
jgi:hypothetical protein